MPDEYDEIQFGTYLEPTYVIDSNSLSIQEKTRELTKGQVDVTDKARSLFYFVRDEIKYDMYAFKFCLEDFIASYTLAKREGHCVRKAVLLAALARAAKIPSSLGFTSIRNYLLPKKTLEIRGTNVFPFHGYAELYLNGKWIKLTPAFDLDMCEKNRIIPVEFDAEHDAMLHSHNRDGKLHIEYLESLGHNYYDLPFDIILQSRARNPHSKA